MSALPTAPTITPTQWRRFHALAGLVRSLRGQGPTQQQCAQVWGLTSKSQTFRVLGQMADAGLIRKLPGRDRAIELCPAFTAAPGPGGQHLIPHWPQVQP